MKENELKLLFDNGGLVRAIVTGSPMGEGWLLQLTLKDRSEVLMETRRGDVRVFVTLDTACKMAKKIGFSVAEVVLRG